MDAKMKKIFTAFFALFQFAWAGPHVAAITYSISMPTATYSVLTQGKITLLAGKEQRDLWGKAVEPDPQTGIYRFEVPTNLPFTVLFHGNPNLKPEMKFLAGKPGTYNQIHVCLMEISQLQEMAGDDSIQEELNQERDLILLNLHRVRSWLESTEVENREQRLSNIEQAITEVEAAFSPR